MFEFLKRKKNENMSLFKFFICMEVKKDKQMIFIIP